MFTVMLRWLGTCPLLVNESGSAGGEKRKTSSASSEVISATFCFCVNTFIQDRGARQIMWWHRRYCSLLKWTHSLPPSLPASLMELFAKLQACAFLFLFPWITPRRQAHLLVQRRNCSVDAIGFPDQYFMAECELPMFSSGNSAKPNI